MTGQEVVRPAARLKELYEFLLERLALFRRGEQQIRA